MEPSAVTMWKTRSYHRKKCAIRAMGYERGSNSCHHLPGGAFNDSLVGLVNLAKQGLFLI